MFTHLSHIISFASYPYFFRYFIHRGVRRKGGDHSELASECDPKEELVDTRGGGPSV